MASVPLLKYILLQITIGPSIICDFLVMTYFIYRWRREILGAAQNHVILCLLIVSFIQKTTDIVFHLYYLRWGIVLRQTYNFCMIWTWLNYSLYCVSLHLITWCCIERHLFVFHHQMMKNKRRLLLFHYFPLSVCLLYTPIFYLCFIFFPTACTNEWNYTVVYCGGACFTYYDKFWGTFDWLFHYGTPTIIIIFTNLFLFCRVIWQTIQRRRPVRWRRQKRLIVQLGFISSLFLILGFPSVVVGCIQLLWIPTFMSNIQNNYFYYASSFINLLLPFVIISSLPKISAQWRRLVKFGKMRVLDPSKINSDDV